MVLNDLGWKVMSSQPVPIQYRIAPVEIAPAPCIPPELTCSLAGGGHDAGQHERHDDPVVPGRQHLHPLRLGGQGWPRGEGRPQPLGGCAAAAVSGQRRRPASGGGRDGS